MWKKNSFSELQAFPRFWKFYQETSEQAAKKLRAPSYTLAFTTEIFRNSLVFLRENKFPRDTRWIAYQFACFSIKWIFLLREIG